MHVFELWGKARAPGANPRKELETPRKAPGPLGIQNRYCEATLQTVPQVANYLISKNR